MPPIAVAVGWASVASVGDKIYVIGGTQANSVGLGASLDLVQIYDINTGETSFGTKMPKGVGAAACGVGPDGLIYVAGGWNYTDVSYYSEVQVYDPVDDSWTQTAGDIPEPIGRSASAMGANGMLYVFGGGWTSNVTLIYNTQTDVWTYGTDQPVSGYDADAVAYSSTAIYVIGGIYSGVSSGVRVYNPVANTWGTAASLPSALTFSASVLGRNGCIYVFGGADTSSTSDPDPTNVVLRYSVADDEWAAADSYLSSGRDHLQVTTDSYGRAVAVGGYSGSGAVANVEAFNMLDVSGEYSMAITSPRDGAIVSGVVQVQAQMVNGWGNWFNVVDLFVDGVLLESQTGNSVNTFLWDTTALADGSSHTLLARGFLWDGRTSEATVTVTVSSMSPEETLADLEFQLAVVQAQLVALGTAMAEANASTMAYLQAQIAILQAALNQIGAGLTAMGAGQTAAMADLNATLVDLQSQLDDFQEQIDRIENKADTAGTYGIVTMVMVILIVVLVALMIMMARKKP